MTESWAINSQGDRRKPPPPASICGIGSVTGYGWGSKKLWEGVESSMPASQRLSGLSAYFEDDWGWAATISDEGDPDDGPSRFSRSLRFAAREAIHDAMSRGWRPGSTVGLLHGLVLGDVDHWRSYHHRRGSDPTKRKMLELMPSTVLTEIMKEFEFHGPAMAVTAMCATGVAGLLTAKMWLDAGLVTDVLVLGADLSVTPENLALFAALGPCVVDAPSTDACRPFQDGSRGFTFGEAAMALVVSSRPEGSYGMVRGGAMTHDAFHPVSLNPDHQEVQRCFSRAIANSGVHPEEIVYLNAHGTGTWQCDSTEGAIFDEMLTTAEGIFSMKPLVAHCQGAAGALEVAVSLRSFETGVIPAPKKVARGHSRLLDGPTSAIRGPIVKSSLGMGGHNAVLILDHPAA